MSSIVLDLQSEVTKSDCDVVSVLRKAHLIAAKLGLTDFDKWILCELNGYQNGDAIPDYRKIRGLLKAFNPYRGWIPTLIPDKKTEDAICITNVPNTISEIIAMCEKDKDIISEFSGEGNTIISNLFDTSFPMKYAVHLPCPSVKDIIEKVKTTILEWTIKLESEGIIGEGMQFDTTEKETARMIPQTTNYYYGSANVFNASVECSVVVAGNNNTVEFTYEKASDAVAEIESAIENDNISAEDKETAIELLTDIKEKITNQKKPTIIKSALIVLKDFL